jgi:hypothetical protein
MIEKLNKYLDGKRKYLLVTLNVALVIFVILEFLVLFSISPPRGYVERDCALSNVGTCH